MPHARVVMTFALTCGMVDGVWGQCTRVQLTDPKPVIDGEFGRGVSIHGSTLLVGRYDDRRVIVFEDLAGWVDVATLVPSDFDLGFGDFFGYETAIQDDFALVSARSDDEVGFNAGAVYVFHRNEGGPNAWGEVAKINGLSASHAFGLSISLSGETAVVGASLGSFIVQRTGPGVGDWTIVTELIDPTPDFDFGASVSISGDTVAAIGDDEVLFFGRDEGGPDSWGFITSVAVGADAVAISGDRAIVSHAFFREARILERNEGGADNWGIVTTIHPPDLISGGGHTFGDQVALSGDVALVGAYNDQSNGPLAGAVYIFARDFGGPDNWGAGSKILPTTEVYSIFGRSIAIDGTTTVVGAPLEHVDGVEDAGAAHVFTGLPDFDCNGNGLCDLDDIAAGTSADCNGNLVPDECDIATGTAFDCDGSGVPDPCKPDADANGVPDACQQFGEGCPSQVITASDGIDDDEYGRSVSIAGSLAVVGAALADGASTNEGAVYLLRRDLDGAWQELTKLTATGAAAHDRFGTAVASDDGDTVIVGVISDDDQASGAGAASIFQEDQGGAGQWGEVIKLLAADGDVFDSLGSAVAISGDTAIVGAPGDGSDDYCCQFGFDNPGCDNAVCETAVCAVLPSCCTVDWTEQCAVLALTLCPDLCPELANFGSAYVFERDAGGADMWGQTHKLVVSDVVALQYTGASVAIDGDVAVVGSPNRDGGAVYLFERDAGGPGQWGEVTKLTAGDGESEAYAGHPEDSDEFGAAIAVLDDTILIGARFAGLGGAAYVFQRDHGGPSAWGQVATLTPSDGAFEDDFGRSVALIDDLAFIGADGHDATGLSSGAVYVFRRDEGGLNAWGELAKTTVSQPATLTYFGRSMAADAGQLIVGLPRLVGSGDDHGAVELFKIASCLGCRANCGNDGDDAVGIADFLALLAQWGTSDTCDLDDDASVGITDLLALLSHWGPC